MKRFFIGLVAVALFAGSGALAHVEEALEEVSGRVELWSPENRALRLSGVTYTLAQEYSVVDRSGQALTQSPQVGQRVWVRSQGGAVFEIVIDVSPQGGRQ